MAFNIHTTTNLVKFVKGTSVSWEALPEAHKSKDTLFFITDEDGTNGRLYLGPKLIGGNISASSSLADLEDILIAGSVPAGAVLAFDKDSKKWVPFALEDLLADILGEMVGASAEADGAAGLVPAPKAGEEGLFLRGDGVWAKPEVALDEAAEDLIKDAVAEKIAETLGNAPEDFDTLKEIADWITGSEENEDAFSAAKRIEDLEGEAEELAGKVEELEAKVAELEAANLYWEEIVEEADEEETQEPE